MIPSFVYDFVQQLLYVVIKHRDFILNTLKILRSFDVIKSYFSKPIVKISKIVNRSVSLENK